jgi:hypothetical protein
MGVGMTERKRCIKPGCSETAVVGLLYCELHTRRVSTSHTKKAAKKKMMKKARKKA